MMSLRCAVRRRGLGMTRLVRDLARPYDRWLALILAAMFVETLGSLAAPWPLKIVIDYAVAHRGMPAWAAAVGGSAITSDAAALALIAAAVLVLIAVVGGVASYIDHYYTESVGQWVANDLRLRIYEHLESLSFRYYDTHDTGALLSTMTDDVATVQDFVSSNALGILVDFTTVLGMLGLMFWLDWHFALIAVAVTPVLLVAIARFRRAMKTATHERRRRESDVMAVVQSGLTSVRTIQALGGQPLEVAKLSGASQAAVASALRARQIKSFLSPFISVVVACCTAIVLWRGTDLVLAAAMTVGSLMVFLAYLARFFKPVQDLGKMTNAVAQTHVALERIVALLDIDMIVQERAGAMDPPAFRGAIEFERVAFAYSPDAPVLEDITVSIRPGTFVGIIGPTGSGKSTVASLIPRFYDPSAGQILVDGADVRDYTLRGLRRQIAFVMQETVLFAGTIRDNIAYGQPGVTDDHIVTAAKLANADEFITRMPDGYKAHIGERGATLSGGQRQRIGIARAFLRNAPILILDEPTASLDPESEQLVMDGIRRLMSGRTVIMITHRLQTLHHADEILVVHGGVVAERGTHSDLLAQDGMYASLYRAAPDMPALTGVGS